MFIKEIQKRNKGYKKSFVYHRLIESYRTDRGPRHRTILNLGRLDIPKDQWKSLADHIEAKLLGQKSLLAVDRHIETLAAHYASLIIHKGLSITEAQKKQEHRAEYETVDLSSLSHTKVRTIGAEYVGLSMFRSLGLNKLFKELGFTDKEVENATLSIVGRLVNPASERRTRKWAQQISGLDELMDTQFGFLPNNALYRILDLLLSHKEKIEDHLRAKERSLFSLKESIILYDLTNTYFEGKAKSNGKAKHSRSKDKRNDCPLVTLGMIIDEKGFPKASKVFKGNVGEPETLKQMVEALQGEHTTSKTTVLIDAGIASEDNLSFLKEHGYDYVCVARNKPLDICEINEDDLLTIKKDKNNTVKARLTKKAGEGILYCKSLLKGKKEQAMRTLFQERFEKGLEEIRLSLSKKGGTKKYDKVLMRLGRLKEKYASIAQYYKIQVHQKEGIATDIKWEIEKQQEAKERFSGAYFLRTSRTDLDEKQIWALYIMLTNVEDAFRYLKSDLKVRPVWHQKESRVDAHLFNTILAYHLLVSIQNTLHTSGIYMRWENVRELLATHVRITTVMKNKEGKQIYIRSCSDPESFHRSIYNALDLAYCPIEVKKLKI